MYYLRSKAAVDPIKFTLSAKHQKKFVAANTDGSTVVDTTNPTNPANTAEGTNCSLDNPDDCLMCGS